MVGARKKPQSASFERSPALVYQELPEAIVRAASNHDTNAVMHFITGLSGAQRFERRSPEGKNLIHYACSAVRKELLADLVQKYRFPIDVVDRRGVHPLHVAAANDRVDQITFLLTAGASPTLLDCEGLSALEYAIKADATHAKNLLIERGGGMEEVEAARRDFRSQALMRESADVNLFWRDAEAVLMMAKSVPLRPFPWDELPKRGTVCLGLTSGVVQLVAGMLWISDSFQFDGMGFAPPISVSSPGQSPNVDAKMYNCLTEHCSVLVFEGAHGHKVVRCCHETDEMEESASGRVDERVGNLGVSLRTAVGREEESLARLPAPCRESLLKRKTKELDAAAVAIVRYYKQSLRLSRFRIAMNAVRDAALLLKRFLSGVVRQRRFAFAINRARLNLFEKFCFDELAQLQTSNFPLILRGLKTISSAAKSAAISSAMELHKIEFVRKLRQHEKLNRHPTAFNPLSHSLSTDNQPAALTHTASLSETARSDISEMIAALADFPRFTYELEMTQLCVGLADAMPMDGIADSLKLRGSLLPRKSMAALQRTNADLFDTKVLAKRRVISVLTELAVCFSSHRSYAESLTTAVVSRRSSVVEEASSGQNTTRRQTKFGGFSSGKRKTRVGFADSGSDQPMKSALKRNGRESRGVSFAAPGGDTDGEPPGKAIGFRDARIGSVAPLGAFMVGDREDDDDEEGGSDNGSRRVSFGEGAGGGHKNMSSSSRSLLADAYPLVCSSRSPIPVLVGSNSALRSMLVRTVSKENDTPPRSARSNPRSRKLLMSQAAKNSPTQEQEGSDASEEDGDDDEQLASVRLVIPSTP